MTTSERDTSHEGWAVVWLTVGLCASELGALVGVYLVLRSTRWTWGWKVAAIAFPACLIVLTRLSPDELTGVGWVDWAASLLLLALIIWAAFRLVREAERGGGATRLGRVAAVLGALILVAAGSAALNQFHRYDYRDNLIAVAGEAASAGDEFGVISKSSGWLDGNGPTSDELAAVAGPGNARFNATFEQLQSDYDDEPPSPGDATCRVFPVVDSASADISTASGLVRFCFGVSESMTYLALAD